MANTYSKHQLEAMRPFAKGQQLVYIDYLIQHGCSFSEAGKQLGKAHQTIQQAVQSAAVKAANSGVAPDFGLNNEMPPGFYLGKSTIQRDKHGEIIQTWDRVLNDKEQRYIDVISMALQETIEGFKPLKPIAPKALGDYDDDIVPWYNIGDAHIGMIAFMEQTGEDFDTATAVRELSVGLTSLIRNTTPSTKCVINDFGDATHYENMAGVTAASGHALDCDKHFSHMISAYVEVIIHAIHVALEVHQTVDVIINQGNHSRVNDLWMNTFLSVLFKDNDRVTILDNTNVFTCYRMGNVTVLTHHGDKCKPDKLIDVLINDYREDYGQTEHHFIWTGHVHHRNTSNEFRGISTESFNTLASKDDYAHTGGYRSKQSITRVDLHKQYGEVGRATLNVQAIRAIIESSMGI